jgi:hypothetical protein
LKQVIIVFIIFWGYLLPGSAPSKAIEMDKMVELMPAEQQAEANTIFMPAIFMIYPRPEGYDHNIAIQVRNTSYEWLMDYTYDLVTFYGPRHHDYYRRFVDSQCNFGGQTYNKHNQLRALNYVESILREFGYTITHEPVPDSNSSYNLIATKPASAEPVYNRVIEIGAHIDTVPAAPGASDNAAGVAGVMEMARLLRNYPNHHPWRFIAFVEEETGILGSYYHVQNIRNQPFKAALVMDTIGWSENEPDYMNCIYADPDIPYTVEIANLFDTVRKAYGIEIGWRRCSTSSMYSDQGRYWQYGLPAVLSVGGLPYTNPTYHKCSDNYDRLNKMNAYLTVKENVGVLLTLDKEP